MYFSAVTILLDIQVPTTFWVQSDGVDLSIAKLIIAKDVVCVTITKLLILILQAK